MHPRNRLPWLLTLATAVALAAACGGQPAEEAAPAPEAAAPAEEPVPAPETPPVVPEPEPEPEPQEPAAPTLQGTIVEVEDAHDMGWTSAASRDTPGRYYWTVRLRNDTTQTLDITVNFQFLDETDGVIKTDTKTERLQPADMADFRVEGEMNRDDSRRVSSYTYSWDWAIVQGG